jgi:hypothetical protein
VGGQPGRRRHLGGVDARRRRAGRGRRPRPRRRRPLYERQDFNFAGPWGDNGFIEDYTAEVGGSRPLGCLHLITFNSDGQTQHIAAHYRPLSSRLFFSHLLRERLAETPYAEHFFAGEA